MSTTVVVSQSSTEQAPFTVLVFTKTAGYRHQSIPAGIAAVRMLGEEHHFRVEATEDASTFTDDRLDRYRVVIFLSTTGNVLDVDQKAAFERYIHRGGAFVGVHSATDTEYGWAWYGQLVGAYFKHHPAIQSALLKVENGIHPSTKDLPSPWKRTDEWYDFREDPSANVSVLLSIDESSYTGGTMGASHPIAWCHVFEGGRSWYTALGHTTESYAEPLYLQHLLGGIEWAAGVAK
jgi:type 1 glutamine amidotransferase